MNLRQVTASAAGLVLLAAAQPAAGGPPFATDDPAPTEFRRWEVYAFANGVDNPGGVGGESGVDLNYGGARDLQLTLVLPLAYEAADRLHAGAGTVELAAKYRFLHQNGGPIGLDLAIFPRLFAPTASDRFGSGRWGLLLPLWAQRDVGGWTLFGGGGYDINPGPGARNFWTGGVAVTRALTERLSAGAEIVHHTRDSVDAKPFTGVNVGITWRAAEHWSLLAAGGPGLQNARDEGRYDFYLALKADY